MRWPNRNGSIRVNRRATAGSTVMLQETPSGSGGDVCFPLTSPYHGSPKPLTCTQSGPAKMALYSLTGRANPPFHADQHHTPLTHLRDLNEYGFWLISKSFLQNCRKPRLPLRYPSGVMFPHHLL